MSVPKEWKNGSGGGTPISAASLIDLENRVKADADGQIKVLNLGADWSAGDNQAGYSAVVTGRRLAIYDGTNSSPRTATAPTVKVVTTSAVKEVTIGAGDGADQLAAIIGVHIGKAGSGTQTVGVAGFAKNASDEEENPDACGLYGVGRITGGTSKKAGAFGAYLAGRRDVDTAIATGVEIQAQNYTATAGSYLSNGSSDTKGIWLNANGEADSGVGIQIQNAFGRQFKVGIGFGNQVAGGKTGGIADSSIRDDSSSTTSVDIRGSHSTAVKIAAGAGHIEINGIPTFIGMGLNGVLAPHGTTLQGSGGIAVVANRAYYARFVAPRNMTVTKIAFVTTTASGSDDAVDVGIYKANGDKLVSSGATTGKLNATAGVQTVTVAETELTAGTVYYAALSVGTIGSTAASIAMTTTTANLGDIFGTAIGTRMQGVQATAHPLGTTATIATGNQVPLLAVRTS